MLIVDSNGVITACSARMPGSVHDAAIWHMTSIRKLLKRQFEGGVQRTYLIGDSGYPLEPWLFTPFHNPQNPNEVRFNTLLTSARNVVERVNGVLKGRFRCLLRHRTLHYNPRRSSRIISTCCILHNFAARRNMDDVDVMPGAPDAPDPAEHTIQEDRHLLDKGKEIRNRYIIENFE
ncbi:putative nuclease HARBI1 [Atheta coriaria]|uniref:putative nuclease HARBI1 n=1 Tax=Dalotia coriaria TaxID=877792 RepID=UPI0031F416EB